MKKRWKIWSSFTFCLVMLGSCTWMEFSPDDNRWTLWLVMNREDELVFVWKLTRVTEKFPTIELRSEYEDIGFDFMSVKLDEDGMFSNPKALQTPFSNDIELKMRRRDETWMSNGMLRTTGCGESISGCVKPMVDLTPVPQVGWRNEEFWSNSYSVFIPSIGEKGCLISLPPGIDVKRSSDFKGAVFVEKQLVYLLNLTSERNVVYVSQGCGVFERVDYTDLVTKELGANDRCLKTVTVEDIVPRTEPAAPTLLLRCSTEYDRVLDLNAKSVKAVPETANFLGRSGKNIAGKTFYFSHEIPGGKGQIVRIELMNIETGQIKWVQFTYEPKIRKPLNRLGEFYQFLGF